MHDIENALVLVEDTYSDEYDGFEYVNDDWKYLFTKNTSEPIDFKVLQGYRNIVLLTNYEFVNGYGGHW